MGDKNTNSPADRTSDLARIRDNQRRSRARRKEYLQELETKWRQCEQSGIEASAEIQAAARKVVDENKRLRALLAKHGISETEIDSSAASSPSSPAAENLTAMLNTTRSCGGGRQRSQQQARPSPQIRMAQTQAQQPTPTRSPLSYSPVPVPGPNYPNLLPSTTTTYQQNIPSTANWDPVSDPNFYSAFDDSYDPELASSCRIVADAIRYIRPNVGGELETEMGCEEGTDCEIPTTQAFDLMDRFSGGGPGGGTMR